jgi:GTPase SAR1 family protein
MIPEAKHSSSWSHGKTQERQPYHSLKIFTKNITISLIELKRLEVNLDVWDCSGMESAGQLRRAEYQDAHLVLIYFDVSNPDSFENLKEEVRVFS